MYGNVRSARQRGFSLVEALFAAVIAAGALAGAAGALAGAVRLSHAATERSQRLSEAQTLAARARAGLADADILSGVAGWRVERRPFARARPAAPAYFEIVSLSSDDGLMSFELLVPTGEAGPQ